MLRKQVCGLQQASQADKKLPLVIKVENERELAEALLIVEKHPHPLRGVSISQSLVTQKSLSPSITYLRIQVHDLSTIEQLLETIALKKRFVEVFIPIELLNDPQLLQACQRAHRIVIQITNQQQPTNYHQLFSQFLLLPHYPLFIGTPFCAIPPEHCYEFFDQNNTFIPPKPAACNGCLFIKHCPFDNTKPAPNFTPKPLTDEKRYNDAITFVKAQLNPPTHHENTPPRI